MSILHFRKQFTVPPVAIEVPGIRVRTFEARDIEPWLALRTRAARGLSPSVRPWSADDFRSEMLKKPWWQSDYTWLATSSVDPSVIGVVTLANREGTEATVPVVHWLLVDPDWRRRGIARMLMSHLEMAAWDVGYRDVQLETHADWHSAVAFYQSIGYAALRDRSPR
jgi:GNAT superfamily N-acetyltransferase